MDAGHRSDHSPSRFGQAVDAIDQITPVLTVIALLMVLTAAVYTLQGQARVSSVIDCFSRYTDDYDAAMTPRLKMQHDLDAAEVENDKDAVEWAKAVRRLLHEEDPGGREFREVHEDLLASLEKVKQARIDVQQTRRANPYPEPCQVD